MGDDRLRKMSFTGSTAVGRTLVRQSADQLLRVSMELGRQCAVPGLRRRRRRGGRRRRDGREDAQHGRGLHVGQPVPGALRRRRRVRRTARRSDEGADPRPRPGRRRRRRTADRREGRRVRGSPGRRGGGRRRAAGHRRPRSRRAGLLLRADGAGRRAHHVRDRQRGDLRSGRADHHVRLRRGGGATGQRHGVRPGRLPLHPRPGAHRPDGRGARLRHGRRQHRPGLQRRRPVRR